MIGEWGGPQADFARLAVRRNVEMMQTRVLRAELALEAVRSNSLTCARQRGDKRAELLEEAHQK